MYMMNEDFLLPAYQKLYAALNSLERFSKGQDLFDNIACIDSFLAEFRNVTFVLQKSLAHTDYVYVYERLRDKYLKNPQCSWLVNKRNEVLKEKPFALEKQLILNLYLPHTRGVFPSEKFTIEDEVDYITLIESVKNIIENIPAIEVYFSTEFIYKEVGSDVNLFETTGYGINSILSLLTDLDKEIGIDVSKSRETIQEKISKLRVHKVPQDAWFTDDYVFYRKGNIFQKGSRIEVITPNTSGIKYTQLCELLGIATTDDLVQDTFEAFKLMHIISFSKQRRIMPTLLTLTKDGVLSMVMYDSSIKTTTYRKINEIASNIKSGADIIAVFLVGEMIYYNNPEMLNLDYRHRVKKIHSEMLSFNKVTKDGAVQYLISSEAILDNSKKCIFPTLTKVETDDSLSFVYPIIEAFSLISSNE
jgi:hypothetical protein